MLKSLIVRLLRRPKNSNKYDYGHVLIVGGSAGMTGAPLLAGKAALRAGAGLVTIASASTIAEKLSARVEEIMTLGLNETTHHIPSEEAILQLLAFIKERKVNVIVIGPGLSRDPAVLKFVREFIEKVKLPIIIDADAIVAYSYHHIKDLKRIAKSNPNLLLTPHPGEFFILTGKKLPFVNEQQKKMVSAFARYLNCTIVLKQHHSLIAFANGKLVENKTGNPGMATAGSGDVLSGVVAALIAQGIKLADASKIGVELHGLAGDLAAAKETQPGMIAGDIIDNLPDAWDELKIKK